MSSSDLFVKLTDKYERQARLYPALLAGAPVLVVAIGIYGIPLEPESGLIGLLATFGIIYLLTTIARELGKRIEDQLHASWGGKPTTQLLRHRDVTLDHVTKTRYHALLATKLGVLFPTPADEIANATAADATYASGATWLLDQTRDTNRFPLLFKELITYGFRRNCLGLKPIAIVIALLSLLWILGATDVITTAGFNADALSVLPMRARVVAAINAVLLIVWIFFISKRTVRTAAFMYADLLLRACDALK
jgi:hypothetical protein